MEVNSIHSIVESIKRKLKNKQINIPADYKNVYTEARMNSKPYQI